MLATGQDPSIAALAGDFLRIIMWAMVPMIARERAAQLRLGARPAGLRHGDHRAGASGSSALANYAFVFGNLGAPALGPAKARRWRA